MSLDEQASNELEGAAQVAPRRLYNVPDCDLEFRHQNPDAADELVIPVHLVCNTPEETLIEHVKANSALDRAWVGTKEAHEGVALVVGGGPSLEDDIETIVRLKLEGAQIFAMNGAATYLHKHGVWADYQVIADAREQTADLIGPAHHHWFASQVHPSLFEKAPEAALFHVNFYENHEDFLKLIEGVGASEFALVGSHGSVGNVALALVAARGYRLIHVFGFDSSHRDGEGHAFSQPMNSSEPITTVKYGGKDYTCTFTMRSQAYVFPRLTYELQDEFGCEFVVHGTGLLPDRWHAERAKSPEVRERDKYTEMWDRASYRDRNPGTEHFARALTVLNMTPGDVVADFGCGTGRAAKMFENVDMKVFGVDIARNALDTDIHFITANLWQDDLPLLCGMFNPDWGYCTDVMEHIPLDKVDAVLANIAKSVKKGAYFAIDSVRDRQGILIGQPLHMTVRPGEWWLDKIKHLFHFVDYYDDGVFACRHAVDPSNHEQPRKED